MRTLGTGVAITTNANSDDSGPTLVTTTHSEVSATNPVKLRFAFDATSNTAYLFNVDTNEYVTRENLTSDYNLTSVASSVTNADVTGKSMFWTDQGNMNFTVSTVTDMSQLAGNDDKFLLYVTTKTPEPATATLSLLALAGLAARRRRH